MSREASEEDLRFNPENQKHVEFRDRLKHVLDEEGSWVGTSTCANRMYKEIDPSNRIKQDDIYSTDRNSIHDLKEWSWSYLRHTITPATLKWLRLNNEVGFKEEDESKRERGKAEQYWRLDT